MITSDLTVLRRLAGPVAVALAVIALVGCGGSPKTVTTTAPHNTTGAASDYRHDAADQPR